MNLVCYRAASRVVKMAALASAWLLSVSYWPPVISSAYIVSAAALRSAGTTSAVLPHLALMALACERWLANARLHLAGPNTESNECMLISQAVRARQSTFGLWPVDACRFMLHSALPQVCSLMQSCLHLGCCTACLAHFMSHLVALAAGGATPPIPKAFLTAAQAG